MVEAIGSKIFTTSKGGVLCLLCFFLSTRIAVGQTISFDDEIDSPTYGEIFIQKLDSSFPDLSMLSQIGEKEWASFFKVFVQGSSRPMLGTYSVQNSRIRFKPRFLPDPDIPYVVTFSPRMLNELVPEFPIDQDLVEVIRFKKNNDALNEVSHVFPASDILPANVLRFYIHFLNPTDFQNPFKYIHIENENGEIISEPFVEMEEGLWSADRKRLTVLIHPGRIKRNVGPNMTIGEVFEVGKSYKLVVSQGWGLKAKYTKSFRIMEAVRAKIDIGKWRLTKPRSGTLQALVVETNRLLDKALSERMISIQDVDGDVIDGKFEYSSLRSRLRFTPGKPWKSALFYVYVDPRLEDVCGNTPQSAFDIEGEAFKRTPEKFRKEFKIK